MADELKVNRRVHFYRVNTGRNSANRLLRFDPTEILTHIQSLPESERRLRLPSGLSSFCRIHSTSLPHKLRISSTRTVGLPPVEDSRGRLRDVHLEPDDEGLAEITHVVFFENNIVGADFNYYGPRVTRVADYFRKVANSLCPRTISFKALLDPEVAQQLNSLRGLRMFELRVQSSDVEFFENRHPGIFGGLRAQKKMGNPGEISIYIKQEKNQRTTIGDEPLQLAKDIANDDESRNRARAFKLKGVNEENRSVPMDLLQDQLLFGVEVFKTGTRSKTIDPNSAFDAIQRVYDENRETIERAAAVEDPRDTAFDNSTEEDDNE